MLSIKKSLLNFGDKSNQLKTALIIDTINEACFRVNLITSYTYQFIRLFCLHCQHINGQFIPITKEFRI